MEETNYTVLPVSVIDIEAVGKSGIRGTEDHGTTSSRSKFSPFPGSIAMLCAEYFLRDATTVIDPFAGWGERGEAIQKQGKKYIGFDTSKEAIDSCAERGVAVQEVDSASAVFPVHDGLFTCPPYWNLEKYSGDGLHKEKTWEQFLVRLGIVFARCKATAMPNSTYCIVVGDWRSAGVYHDLVFQVESIMSRLGCIPFDKVVVSRKTISKIKIMLPQAKRLGYTVKVHDTLLVYKIRTNLQ